MQPVLSMSASIPDRPRKLLRGEHMDICKRITHEVMTDHHQLHAGRHFTVGAAARYGYAPRKPSYRRWKTSEAARKRAAKMGFALVDQDLVLTGASRRKIVAAAPVPSISTAGFGLTFEGRYGVRFAWRPHNAPLPADDPKKRRTRRFRDTTRFGRPRVKPGVTTEQMRKEMGRWADDETAWAARQFAWKYFARAERVRGQRLIGAAS